MNTKKCNERHRKRSADRLSGDVGYSRYSDGSVTWGDWKYRHWKLTDQIKSRGWMRARCTRWICSSIFQPCYFVRYFPGTVILWSRHFLVVQIRRPDVRCVMWLYSTVRNGDMELEVRRASIGGTPVTSLGLWPSQPANKSPLIRASAAASHHRDHSKPGRRPNSSNSRMPLLENCVIPTDSVDIGQR